MLLVTIVIASVPIAATLLFICLSLLFSRQLKKKRWATDPPDVQVVQFLEGASAIWRNPLFLGVASAKSFAPSPFAEYLYYGDLLSWGLFLTRLVALAICVALWSWLYRLGYESVGHYLKHRYRNRFLVGLYNVNLLIGTIYIYKSGVNPIVYAFIEFYKTNNYVSLAFLCFLGVTSFGGFNVTMFAVIIHCLLEVLGQTLVSMSISSISNITQGFISTPIAPCFVNLGVAEFLPLLSHLITILPVYQILRKASSLKKLRASVVICATVLFCDQFWSMLLASKVKEVGIYNSKVESGVDDRSSLWIRSFLGGVNVTSERKMDQEVTTWSPPTPMTGLDFDYGFWDFPSAGAVVLFWTLLGHLNMFTALQLHIITVHAIQHCIPTWLRDVVASSVSEFRLFYICVRFFFSIIVMMLIEEGVYELVHPEYKGIIVHTPLLESTLTIAVCVVTVTGWMVRSVGPVLMSVQVVVEIVGMHFLEQILTRDFQETDFVTGEMIWREGRAQDQRHICSAAWLPSLVTFVLLLVALSTLICCHPRHSIILRDSLGRGKSSIEEAEENGESSESSEEIE
ncbi:hypothetical protein EGR_03354 [Echinococcus granulosus]|uniref:Uncharacterized protein n=1 Tax=Echinococcus granulosus TaxID=6210 RepID=W6UL60_ECHGR|nr:hypothetical protein EGR_03354 [Echinococcus granulosus]EUB61808.1 hypothetical protein EGR_03354 [Echinococcus granulosus]